MIRQSTAPYGIALLRVSLGILFLAHAAMKVFIFTVPGFVGYFGSLGLSPAFAYFILALEIIGGVALVLGIYASWVALPLAVELLGTIVWCTVPTDGCSQTKAAGGNSLRCGPLR